MRCLVTGAAGFIGSSLSEELLEDGHEVVAIDSFVPYYPRKLKENNLKRSKDFDNFRFVEDNLLTVDLDTLCDGVELVFHQAAQAGVRASWGKYFNSYTDNNILATQRILEHVKTLSSLKKVVYASSSSVYGDVETLPTKEDMRPQPVSPYGVTKLAAEHLMVLYARVFSVPTVSLRYFTVFGPRQRPDMAFNRFIQAGLRQEPLTLYGDGEQSRDFTFISDIVNANILAAEKGKTGAVYNIGGGTTATVNEVLGIIESFIGPLKIEKHERQAGDAKHTSADCSLAAKELGFKPAVSLVDGIEQEVKWLEQVNILKENENA